jgi:hypothetical protein
VALHPRRLYFDVNLTTMLFDKIYSRRRNADWRISVMVLTQTYGILGEKTVSLPLSSP